MKPLRQLELFAISFAVGVSAANANPSESQGILSASSPTVSNVGGFAGSAATRLSATLADDSPFLPRDNARTQGVGTNADPLELRGVMSDASGKLYYLYDRGKKHGVWVGRNDTENPFVIVSDDANKGNLEIRMNDGRILNLKLLESKTSAGGIIAADTPSRNEIAVPGPIPAGLTEVQAAWREEYSRRVAENAASK